MNVSLLLFIVISYLLLVYFIFFYFNLPKIYSRCLLHNKGAPGAKIIRRMFDRILDVWNTLRSHPINDPIPVHVHEVMRGRKRRKGGGSVCGRRKNKVL
jgi:hypothetical protein